MREFLWTVLLAICLMLVFCPAVTAWNVTRLMVDPPGAVTPGTPMIITGTIHLEPYSDKSFVSPIELRSSTSLEKATWNYSLVLDGRENPQPQTAGKFLSISGWLLSSPGATDESVRFTLSGIIPSVTQTQNTTLVRIQETDEQGTPVSKVSYEYHTLVVNPGPPIHKPESALGIFRSHIDEKIALGVNTSAAEVKYAEADAKTKSAGSRPSSQYQLAYADLDAAQAAIDDGERLLDKAWAEKAVADAQKKVDQMDALIGWYKSNGSTANDAVLPSVVTRREVAMAYLTVANDEISNGNYDLARLKAQEAYNKANESYTNGNSRKDRTGGSDRLFPLYIAACIIVTILLVIGIVWWRKQKGAKPE
jgi:hypothetical protein